ncbi:MAG: hypothetical protein R6U44_05430 [Archaeoglobaceae archaeon]
MSSNHSCFQVEMARILAIVRVNLRNESSKTIYCSNLRFCEGFDLATKECPSYCQIIAEVKNYITGKKKPKAAIREIKEEKGKYIANKDNDDPTENFFNFLRMYNYDIGVHSN